MENNRNWLDLPGDVLLMILMKLQQQEVLESAQFVCKMWYDICKDPSMWRSIRFKDLINPCELPGRYLVEPKVVLPSGPTALFNRETMVYNAVDRSVGGLIDISFRGSTMPDGIWSYVAAWSTQLKRLRLARCYITSKDLIEALPKLTSLEELELTLCSFDYFRRRKIIFIIKSCPLSVTTLKLNELVSPEPLRLSDKVAQAVAENLPQVRHLQLVGNNMTNVGLTTILDGFPRLQSLDLRACFHLDLEGDLGMRLSKQVTDLQLPYDSTDDYDYPTLERDYIPDGVMPYVSVDFDEIWE